MSNQNKEKAESVERHCITCGCTPDKRQLYVWEKIRPIVEEELAKIPNLHIYESYQMLRGLFYIALRYEQANEYFFPVGETNIPCVILIGEESKRMYFIPLCDLITEDLYTGHVDESNRIWFSQKH